MSGPSADNPPPLGPGLVDQSKTSRENSPARTSRSVSAIPQLSRSRKNSQEFSPTRNATAGGSLSTVPSAAAVQRALSAQRPILPPASVDGVLEGVRNGERQMKSGQTSPSWRTAPRVKSPPPKNGRLPPPKKSETDQTLSNTSSKRLAAVSSPEQVGAMLVSDSQEPERNNSTLRTPRGPSTGASSLETVAESSLPTTPSIGPVLSSPLESRVEAQSLDQKVDAQPDSSTAKEGDGSGGDASTKPNTIKAENGRRSRAPSTSRPASELAKRSLTNLTTAKNKPTNDPPRTMTVETETVTSMPQLLNPDRGASGRDATGSIRAKPSSETIRPKKEKKKTTRKTPSLHAGTATSKADLFEARVASAVDEADSSDSDETFVYESNPVDRPMRHHSRTPSATSLTSQDQFGTRNKHGVRNGSHAIAGKKSMKFSSNTYNNHLDGEPGTDGRGSQRNASSTPRHHHISRHGRPHHTSILDTDSPFTQASKQHSPRSSVNNVSRFSRPNSPRVSNGRLPNTSRKGEPYDAYDDAADDERAPLIGSVRVNRSRHSRRPQSGSFRPMEYNDGYEPNYCGRWGSCAFLTFILVLVCVGIATFVMAVNRPMMDVSIKHIQNVLASEQEIMLDLHVEAVNMNLFAITVSDLDVNLFAESPYVGTTEEWKGGEKTLRWVKRGNYWPPWQSQDGVDEGTDPIDDPEPGTQKMLLGRIFEFDSPLVFDASPVRRIRSSSVGEIRLAKPGNQTEEGGSARWERVLQHPFDLIVRGVIKYQLPLSSKSRSAKIGSRIKVLPSDDTGDGPGDKLNSSVGSR